DEDGRREPRARRSRGYERPARQEPLRAADRDLERDRGTARQAHALDHRDAGPARHQVRAQDRQRLLLRLWRSRAAKELSFPYEWGGMSTMRRQPNPKN